MCVYTCVCMYTHMVSLWVYSFTVLQTKKILHISHCCSTIMNMRNNMRTPLVQGSTPVMTDNLNKNHACHIQRTFTKPINTIRQKYTEPPREFFFLTFGLKEAFTLHLNSREGQILHEELTGLQNPSVRQPNSGLSAFSPSSSVSEFSSFFSRSKFCN